jgi:hypothetical protein
MVRGYPIFFSLRSLPHYSKKKSQNKNSLTSILFGSGGLQKTIQHCCLHPTSRSRLRATRSRRHVVYAVHLYLLDRRCAELCRSSHELCRGRPRLTATPFGNEPKKNSAVFISPVCFRVHRHNGHGPLAAALNLTVRSPNRI